MNPELLEKLEELAAQFGVNEFDGTLNALDDFEPHPGDGDTGGHVCPDGYKWSTRLKKCVADIG